MIKKNYYFIGLIILIVTIFLDYNNIVTNMGINVNNFNLDFWDIFLSNGIVVLLAIITYFLFDKRKLEKEKMANYAALSLLIDTYNKCDVFLDIITIMVEAYKSEQIKDECFSSKQIDFIMNEAFTNDDKIFECLKNGYIQFDRYENYTKIKLSYESLVYCQVKMGLLKINDVVLNNLKNEVDIEKKALEEKIKKFMWEEL